MILIGSNVAPKRKTIFHKSKCFYVDRISESHCRILDNDYVRRHHYHECKYCSGFAGDMRIYKKYMNEKTSKENMKFYIDYDRNALFVETKVGLWKLYRDSNTDTYVLYHHNFYKPGISADIEMKKRNFHRQIDVKETENMEVIFNYIIAHDKAKEIINDDYRNLPTTSKKQKKYYKQAKNRDRRKQVRRVDQLFIMLEAQNDDFKRLSIG